jgi:hypothetical protein
VPLKNRDFLELVRLRATERLVLTPEYRLRGSLIQLYYDAPEQHYEVWLRPQAGLVELGLHFEGEREDNHRRLAAVAEAMPLVVAALGDGVDIEEWTERWTRVHETLPLRALDEAFTREVGDRLARYAEVLQPLVAPLGPIRAAPRGVSPRGRYPRRRRLAAG